MGLQTCGYMFNFLSQLNARQMNQFLLKRDGIRVGLSDGYFNGCKFQACRSSLFSGRLVSLVVSVVESNTAQPSVLHLPMQPTYSYKHYLSF